MIGNYNWFIRVADEELLDGSVAIEWVGITNVGKTPYIVMASYPKEKSQSLGEQILGLRSTIKLKE